MSENINTINLPAVFPAGQSFPSSRCASPTSSNTRSFFVSVEDIPSTACSATTDTYSTPQKSALNDQHHAHSSSTKKKNNTHLRQIQPFRTAATHKLTKDSNNTIAAPLTPIVGITSSHKNKHITRPKLVAPSLLSLSCTSANDIEHDFSQASIPCATPQQIVADVKKLSTLLTSFTATPSRLPSLLPSASAASDAEWTDALQLLSVFRRLVHHHTAMIVPYIETLHSWLAESLSSLRSAQVKHTLTVTEEYLHLLSTTSHSSLSSYIPQLISTISPSLLRLVSGSGDKFLSQATFRCISLCVYQLSAIRCLYYYGAYHHAQSKNKLERQISACSVHQALMAIIPSSSYTTYDKCPGCNNYAAEQHNTNKQISTSNALMNASAADLSPIFLSVCIYLSDASPATRFHAKQALTLLSQHLPTSVYSATLRAMPFDDGEKIKKEVTHLQKKEIATVLTSSSSSPAVASVAGYSTPTVNRSKTMMETSASAKKAAVKPQYATMPTTVLQASIIATADAVSDRVTNVDEATPMLMASLMPTTLPAYKSEALVNSTSVSETSGSTVIMSFDTPPHSSSSSVHSFQSTTHHYSSRPSIMPFLHEEGIVSPITTPNLLTAPKETQQSPQQHHHMPSIQIIDLDHQEIEADNDTHNKHLCVTVSHMHTVDMMDMEDDGEVIMRLKPEDVTIEHDAHNVVTISGEHSRNNSEDNEQSTMIALISAPQQQQQEQERPEQEVTERYSRGPQLLITDEDEMIVDNEQKIEDTPTKYSLQSAQSQEQHITIIEHQEQALNEQEDKSTDTEQVNQLNETVIFSEPIQAQAVLVVDVDPQSAEATALNGIQKQQQLQLQHQLEEVSVALDRRASVKRKREEEEGVTPDIETKASGASIVQTVIDTVSPSENLIRSLTASSFSSSSVSSSPSSSTVLLSPQTPASVCTTPSLSTVILPASLQDSDLAHHVSALNARLAIQTGTSIPRAVFVPTLMELMKLNVNNMAMPDAPRSVPTSITTSSALLTQYREDLLQWKKKMTGIL